MVAGKGNQTKCSKLFPNNIKNQDSHSFFSYEILFSKINF